MNNSNVHQLSETDEIPRINIPSNKASESENNNSKDKSNEGESNKTTLQNLNKIFLNNSQYNNKDKDYFMSRFQIIDILKKSRIISKNIITKTSADIILSKLYPYKRKYNLVDFMNYLTEICHSIYKEKFESSPKETMDYFLNCFFNNYNEILKEKNSKNFMEKMDDNSCTIKCIETIITSKIQKPIVKLLLSLYDSFKKLYKVYFKNETNKNINISVNQEMIMTSSSDSLLQFSKDFEIVPYIISKSNLNTYYNFLLKYQNENPEIMTQIMNSGDKKYKDLGICFKLSSFILFIYHYSIFLYYKEFKTQYIEDINNSEYETSSDVDKIIFFLQKLENSNGIKRYLSKKERTNENKFTFIPNEKDIEVANEEMKMEKNKTNKNDNKNTTNNNLKEENNKKNNIESSPYESIDFTERKIVNNYKSSPIKESLLKNKTFNGYFKDKKDNYLSLTELKKILNVCASIKNVIISNIENLSEIFLQYSKIHDKLDYNRMSISSFLQFLKDSNILLVVPDEMKNNFRKLSHKLITRNYNISKVKNFNRTLKYSVSCKNIPMTDKEKDYKKNVSQLVNANAAKENEDKINVSEASIIFSSLTSSYNFPSHKIKIKENFKENIYIGINKDKTFSFDTKREQFKKNIPNKMNFILFIKSFELISERLYPEMTLDDAMANLLNKKILPFIKERKINIINSNEMKEALSKMNDHNIKNFLVKLGNVISPLYSLFADIDGNMKFYQFFDFYKYFDIFPELLSLSQMKAIFFTLCESSSVSLENNNKACTKKTEQIDFILFLESLGISSMFFNFKDIISDIDRLLYICYFIWKSDGIKKQKISQNIPQKINNNFIELFKMYNYNNFNNEDGISLSNKTLNMTERRQGRSYANKNNSNQNSGKKLVLTYNNFDKEYNCSVVNREKYKFEDIYK